ncbi:Type III secretion system protein [Pseudomonas amygdali pv. morsprunorum]|nr:Type III secretion system protein [Pseudomonas amygdali pv. eriobotryae]RML88115.1 Type III secretion system protein [Pseudomonas savastanoi]RMO96814.1 Type III secretion system protein [Pseudomonas amygdali pv. morsprunorum]RMP57454.1 Type III secretion system protein [Pseudomonas savastanoi pv. retacarpa]RMS85383.1 Type III secretion system protein [Pseudomonas savastanoi]
MTMTAPIKHPAKAPTAPPVVHATPPSAPTQRAPDKADDKPPAFGSTTRTDMPKVRFAQNRSATETPESADGLFFSQLLIPQVGEEPDQQGFGGSSIALPAHAENVPTQLIDELAQRLPEQPAGPLAFTLLMPSLGTVRVNAEKTEHRWSIQLGFARRDVLKRLQGHTGACRDSLSRALGHDVELDLHEDLAA